MISIPPSLRPSSLKSWLLCAIFFLLPWQTRFIFDQATIGGDATPFGVLSVYAVEVLVLVTALVTMLRKVDRPKIDATYRVPIVLSIAVFVMAAISLLSTSHIDVSWNALFHLGCAMVFFALLLDRKVALKPLLLSFAAGLVIPMGLGVWQVIFDGSPASTIFGLALRDANALGDAVTVGSDGVRQLRAYGSFPHPNIFGGYLAVGLLACAGLFREVKKPKYLLLIPVVFAVLLALSASRAAILGLILGMFLAGLVARLQNVKLARILVIPIAIAVIGGAMALSFATPLAEIVRSGETTSVEARSIEERVEQYFDYPAALSGRWLLGNGLGAYTFAAFDAGTCRDWDCQPIHNIPLLILAEIGLLGALVVFAWSSSIDRINFNRFPNRDALVAFAMGNVVLVILFFDHWIWSQWAGLALIAFVMALTVRMGEDERA